MLERLKGLCWHLSRRRRISFLWAFLISSFFVYYIRKRYCPLHEFTLIDKPLPVLKTYKINKFEYNFIINGKAICSPQIPPFLLIFVESAFTHTQIREAIRQTWASPSSTQLWADGTTVNSVKVVFVFGVTGEKESYRIPERESRLYGDVIQADFVDSYANLTIKTIAGIKWMTRFCPAARYVMKADDDVFLHLPNFVAALRSIPSEAFFLGINACHNKVQRSGKWGVSERDYPYPTFPKYINGYFYAFSRDVAHNLSHLAEYCPNLPAEDVIFTGILRQVIGAEVIKREDLFCRSLFLCDFYSATKAGIGATGIQEMHELWDSSSKNNDNYQRYLFIKYFFTHYFGEKQ